MTTIFNQRFEKTWDRYLNRHKTEITLTGKKYDIMKEPPVFKLYGAFSGWNDADEKRDILAEVGTIVKLKISDLEKTYSQPGVIKGNGQPISTSTPQNISDNILFLPTVIGESYKINLNVSGENLNRVMKIYDENNSKYSQMILNISRDISINIVATGENLYIDYSEGTGDINCTSSVGQLDGSVPCPIYNLKADIDFITANGHTFKIDSQKQNGSNNLMVLTLSNVG